MSAKLSYKCLGAESSNKPVVVMLHGFLGSKESWQPLLAPYLSDYAFLLIDLPGHGDSPSLTLKSGETGFEAFNHLLVELFQKLGVTRYALFGYSLGGRLALYHAAQQPAGVTGLMLESCHPGLKSVRQKLSRKLWQKQWQVRIKGQRSKQWLNHWYRQQVFASLSPTQRAAQVKAKLKKPRSTSWAHAMAAWAVERQPSLWSVLKQPEVPTHFLVGAGDPNYVKLARRLRRAHWPLNIHISRKAGHNVHATATKEWHQAFCQWLTRN